MSRSLRIVFGVTSREWGGNEKWVALAATALERRGHHVSVFWSHAEIAKRLDAEGLENARVTVRGDFNPLCYLSLIRHLRGERPDVVVLTKQREYLIGGMAARHAGRPLVVLRLGIRRRLHDDRKRRRAFGALSDLVIVNSELTREGLLESPWFDASKVRVIYNGVEARPADEGAGRAVLRRIGLPESARVVVAVGRLMPQKGFDVLLPAFARSVSGGAPVGASDGAATSSEGSTSGAATSGGELHLVILGEGRDRHALERAAVDLGLSGRVHLPGHVEPARDVMAAADLYVLSSRNEGMANTLLEAMSVGLPIVATDVSGTAEAVRDGVEGLIVPPEQVTPLATAMNRLLLDSELAESLGAAARRRAMERYSVERMAEDLEREFTAELRRLRAAP